GGGCGSGRRSRPAGGSARTVTGPWCGRSSRPPPRPRGAGTGAGRRSAAAADHRPRLNGDRADQRPRLNCRVGSRRTLRRLFAKFADLKSGFLLPFFFALAKGAESELFGTRMRKAPPGTLKFGREKERRKGCAA